MNKRVYLHIGHLKTGTTYLQDFCQRHRQGLAQWGVLYPEAGTTLRPGTEHPSGNHGVLALGLMHRHGLPVPKWYRAMRAKHPERYDSEAQWTALRHQISQSPCPSALISSEFFISYGSSPRSRECLHLAAHFLRDFEVRVCCYLRRPDHMIQSFYNEIVKTGAPMARLRGNVSKYRNTPYLDYASALGPWVETYGKDSVIIRNYDRLMEQDIVADFSKLLECPALKEMRAGILTSNSRIPNALIELKRLHNGFPKASQSDSFTQAADTLNRGGFLIADEQVSLFSQSDRAFLFEHTTKQNERLRSLFEWPSDFAFFENFSDIFDDPEEMISEQDAAIRYSGIVSFLSTAKKRRLSSTVSSKQG